jgi:hypothetical protein
MFRVISFYTRNSSTNHYHSRISGYIVYSQILIIGGNVTKIYKFYKPGCQPCVTLKKIMNQVDLSNFEIIDIDMSLEENKVQYPEIDVVPVLMKEDGTSTRLLPKYKLEAWLDGK